ncbi:MarR family winged helix-turn-helix transcriptional regulator [Luteitalea sp.]
MPRPLRSRARPASARPTSAFVGHLLVKAAMRVRAATAAALGPLQLTPQEFGLLNQVVTAPALTQVQLGSLLGIDRTTVVAMLDRLMAQGWIERAVDAGDRRVHRIVGTPAGADVHARAAAAPVRARRR